MTHGGALEVISIHALREEGDGGLPGTHGQPRRISIHALREEGDSAARGVGQPDTVFLSTPSARRATVYDIRQFELDRNFYPRPPRGGRRFHVSVF